MDKDLLDEYTGEDLNYSRTTHCFCLVCGKQISRYNSQPVIVHKNELPVHIGDACNECCSSTNILAPRKVTYNVAR